MNNHWCSSHCPDAVNFNEQERNQAVSQLAILSGKMVSKQLEEYYDEPPPTQTEA